jgi:uncharacterized repeat protein (TIGR03803 family)
MGMLANKIIKHFYRGVFSILLFSNTHFTILAQCPELHAFNGIDGKQPTGSLIFVGASLYGMTPYGGSMYKGTMFKIESDGSGFTVLYDFSNNDGKWPKGTLLQVGSYLYGTTGGGGINDNGIIFRIKPDGSSFQKLHDFNSAVDGNAGSYGALYFDGSFLYGNCISGGSNNAGTVYKIMLDGSNFSVLHNFDNSNGALPNSGLIDDGIFLYGAATTGGTNCPSCGLVYKIKPDGSYFTILYEFTGAPDGDNIPGDLYFDGTYLYGMNAQGGTFGFGTIFKLKRDGTGYSKIFDFDGSGLGGNPNGGLISDGIRLYGTTFSGGLNNKGVVFGIKPDGSNFSVLCQLNQTGMGNSERSLCSDDSFLYGMTNTEGGNGDGSIFRVGMYTGIRDQKNKGSLKIFPNPAKNEVEISGIKYSKDIGIIIYSSCGEKEMLIKPEFSDQLKLDISKLSKGLHFIIINSELQSSVEKLIILE